tara:strand:- start:214 stop:1506 length:1293 start_codon:yes stop_codon:yes gene_type:complete
MIPSEIIEKKRDGINLNKKEIKWFINSLVNNKIDTSQLSALLMSIYFQGMTDEELFVLVEAMVESGKKFDFNHLDSYIADKHSTGGVGDKISFILAPILSSLGIIVPMIAGGGLAYTGGTIDKLRSIPKLQTSLSIKSFKDQIEAIGCCIASQSSQICPADNTLYRVRDLTGTVPSLPLICSSIMSKKIAEGLNGLVMDIKVGNGTFMKTIEEAKQLAHGLKKIGAAFNIDTDIVYSDMNQPLGKFAGLHCEVLEAIDCLKGNGPKDLIEVSFRLGGKILMQSNTAKDIRSANKLMLDTINNGKAFKKFEEIINAQNGDISYLNSKYIIPKHEITVKSNERGFVSSLETEKIGWSLVEIGCGRKVEKDKLDYSAGIEFIKKIGDKVNKGDTIYRIFGNNLKKLNNAKTILDKTYFLTDVEVLKPKLIINK